MAKKEKRFEQVFVESSVSGGKVVVVDRQTKVQYLCMDMGFGGGITVLVDKEGKPLLYEGEIESK